jgi:hypothetical protein
MQLKTAEFQDNDIMRINPVKLQQQAALNVATYR